MNTIKTASWITPAQDYGDTCPVFKKEFEITKPVRSATLEITALGIYEAQINGEVIGDFVFAPGWTSYDKRLQVQAYDVTNALAKVNELSVSVGNGWCVGRLAWDYRRNIWSDAKAIIAAISIEYGDGTSEVIRTDDTWQTAKGPVLFSELYDGETYDARVVLGDWAKVKILEHSKDILIPQEGEKVIEKEKLPAKKLIITPAGEKVIDFGQNITGYLQFRIEGCDGEVVEISHAEILDTAGNFYTENLRTAKQKLKYICDGNEKTYHSKFSFMGFRYIRLDKWPLEVDLNDFVAIVVHSDMKRTGHFECSNPLVNQLFQNVIWGQKGNFLDIPTDCPQRDERLGWTGDAQVFVKTASYNFDVNNFFVKWLHDLKAEQNSEGGIPHVIPDPLRDGGNSSAWADAAVICPWQLYLTYGNVKILEDQFDSMKAWVEYVHARGENEYLWLGDWHFGDWLNLDPAEIHNLEAYKSLIASAFYAYSTSLLIKAGKVLSRDVSSYELLYPKIVEAFQNEYIKDGKLIFQTQTAHVLALYFNLASNKAEIADSLAKIILENGTKLSTGFVGTPYLLHSLSQNDHAKLAYSLLLQEDYPSWLYPVRMGATTIWEHWNGIDDKGNIMDPGMNSFNHYAYGACADWMYGVMAGINIDEKNPAFKHIIFKPLTDSRIDFVNCSILTRHGLVSSNWKRLGEKIEFTFEVPIGCSATIELGAETDAVEVGSGVHGYII